MAKKASGTPAILALGAVDVAFELLEYAYDPDAANIAMQAADALGEPPARVLKTLIARVDARPVCIVLPADAQASMKKVAAAFGGKRAEMMQPADAERITGYRIGGVSPFGQRRRLPIAIEQAALEQPYVFVNAGGRGLQLRMDPADLVRVAGASVVSLTE